MYWLNLYNEEVLDNETQVCALIIKRKYAHNTSAYNEILKSKSIIQYTYTSQGTKSEQTSETY